MQILHDSKFLINKVAKYVLFEFHFPWNSLVSDIYQRTLIPVPHENISHISDVGLKFEKTFDLVYVSEVMPASYADHYNISCGSLVVGVNGIPLPFFSVDRITEFIKTTKAFSLPITLDLLAMPPDDELLRLQESEVIMKDASLSAYNVVKASECIRAQLLSLHEYYLCPTGLSDLNDTSILSCLGQPLRGALLPFLCGGTGARAPTGADMIHLIDLLQDYKSKICELGQSTINITLIVLYILCSVDEKCVHREVRCTFFCFL